MQKHLKVVSYGFGTEAVFGDMFDYATAYFKGRNLELTQDDVLVLEGGTDINPELYGQKPIGHTQRPDVGRDMKEVSLVKQAIALGVPIIGICRGAQLLCAMAGGSLVQHVLNHGIDHSVETYDGDTFKVTSAHHQMMNPKAAEHLMIAWSERRANIYFEEEYKEVYMDVDPEIVWFPKIKGLAIQAHPEWMPIDSAGVLYMRSLVSQFVLNIPVEE